MVSITERTAIDSSIQPVITRCVTALKEVNRHAQVVLYGSYARGDNTSDSDIVCWC
jgi:predicted nucleotidyltransferase